MEEKKGFFEMLNPKSALMLGLAGGILVLGTIGFLVLGAYNLSGIAKAGEKVDVVAQTDVATGQQQVPPTVTKSDKPKVELFVMSYCPYGLQMEKAILPAMELLKGKADIQIKFVSYIMHGLKEIEENNRQYCISTEQSDKYLSYLNCFVLADDSPGCLKKAGINEGKMNSCISKTNSKFSTITKYNDQTTWLNGNYPLYPVQEVDNKKYSVGGSPTLIINGVEASADRSPEAVKNAICAAFNQSPSECGTKLDATPSSAGFGAGAGAANAAGGCGN